MSKISQYCVDVDNNLDNPSFEFTQSGWLRVKGAIARTGNLTYKTQDGRQFYQYVPPDTLFADSHLASIAGSPVTLDHPPETVTPGNSKKYVIGSVGDRVFANVDKGLLEVVFTIYDSDAIEAITKNHTNQLSMGYWADLEVSDSPDTFIQTSRNANHIAIVDKARGGDALKLQLDSYCILYPDSKITLPNNQHLIEEEDNSWQILSVTV